MNSVLTREEIDSRFTLLAWRGISVAAVPGLRVQVRSGSLRVREGAYGSPQILDVGGCFVARGDGLVELKAHVHTELRLEWPETVRERLSPGLEPIAMEPLAQVARP